MSFLRSMLVHNDHNCAGTGGAIFESKLTARGRTWHVQSRTIYENAHFFQDIHSVTISLLFLTSSYFLAFFQLALFPQPGCRIFSIFLPPSQTNFIFLYFPNCPNFQPARPGAEGRLKFWWRSAKGDRECDTAGWRTQTAAIQLDGDYGTYFNS